MNSIRSSGKLFHKSSPLYKETFLYIIKYKYKYKYKYFNSHFLPTNQCGMWKRSLINVKSVVPGNTKLVPRCFGVVSCKVLYIIVDFFPNLWWVGFSTLTIGTHHRTWKHGLLGSEVFEALQRNLCYSCRIQQFQYRTRYWNFSFIVSVFVRVNRDNSRAMSALTWKYTGITILKGTTLYIRLMRED